eukprot:300455-Pelagomonas_calceolata.AAC.5
MLDPIASTASTAELEASFALLAGGAAADGDDAADADVALQLWYKINCCACWRALSLRARKQPDTACPEGNIKLD